MVLKPPTSTMGPFTLSQLVPGKSGKGDNDIAAAQKAVAPPQGSLHVNQRFDLPNSNGLGKIGPGPATRRSSRIIQNPQNILEEMGRRDSSIRKPQGNNPNKEIKTAITKPQLGDLDSSDEEEEEKEAPKSLEQQASNLLAQAVKRPVAPRASLPNASASTTSGTDSAVKGEETENKTKSKRPTLLKTSFFSSMRKIKSNDEQPPPKSLLNDNKKSNNNSPPNSNHKRSKILARGSSREIKDPNNNPDATTSTDSTPSSEIEPSNDDGIKDRVAQGLGRQKGTERLPESSATHLQDSAHVRRLAPRQYSSGGRLDAKLERGSAAGGGGDGPITTRSLPTTTRSLESDSDDGVQSVPPVNTSIATSSVGVNGRLQGRRIPGRPGEARVQRSSSVNSNLNLRKKPQPLSRSASVRDYHPDDDNEEGLYQQQDEQYEMTTDDLYGRRQSQHQPLSRLSRRSVDPYERKYDDDDEEQLGYGDASPDSSSNPRTPRRSIGYGPTDSDYGSLRQQRSGSIGYHGAAGGGGGGGLALASSMRKMRNGSIGYGARGGDALREDSQRKSRSGSIGYGGTLADGGVSEERSHRGQRSSTSESHRGSSKSRLKPGTNQNRSKSKDRSPNAMGEREGGVGLEGSKRGQRRSTQHGKDSLSPPDQEISSRGKRTTDHSTSRHSSLLKGGEEDASSRGKRTVDSSSKRHSSIDEQENPRDGQKNAGKLDAKFAKQTMKKKRASLCSAGSRGSRGSIGSRSSRGSRGSASSGEGTKDSKEGGGRRPAFPPNNRSSISSGNVPNPGKLDRKLSSNADGKQRKFNDSIRSGNSDQSGDTLGSSKSERSAKLGKMLCREVENKRRSLHDSMKSGTSNGSGDSALSTRSGPAAFGKFVGRNSLKNGAMGYGGMVSSYTQAQAGDSDSERSQEDILEKSDPNHELDGSVASIQSCHTMGNIYRSGARNPVKADDTMQRRSFSLTTERRSGNKIVRSFSMRKSAGSLLQGKPASKIDVQLDDESVKDEIIGYSDNEHDYGDDGVSGEDDDDEDHDQGQRQKRPATSNSKVTGGKSKGNPGRGSAKAKAVFGDSSEEDHSSVQSSDSDGSADLWDEFENGSMIDSDSNSSGSDHTDDMIMSGSNRIVNWEEVEDERPDYMNPAMSPASFGRMKVGKPATKIAIDGLPPQATLKSNSFSSRGKSGRSKRQSLLGGLEVDDDEIADTASGSVLDLSASEENLESAKRLKVKKSKRDVLKGEVDKYDWAKEKRDKKKKKETDDDVAFSQHSKNSKKDSAKKEKIKRSQSDDGLAHTKTVPSTPKSPSKTKLRRSLSKDKDAYDNARMASEDASLATPKTQKKVIKEAIDRGLSKSPMVGSKSAHSKLGERARSSKGRKLVAETTEPNDNRADLQAEMLPSSGASNRFKSKGVRRTKSLCLTVDGVGNKEKLRASSVKRSNSTVKKHVDDMEKRDKSKVRKKKASSDHDADEGLPEWYRLLEGDAHGAFALLRKDPSLAKVKDKSGCYALHHAAQRDFPLETIEKLIEFFPDACDAQCDKGFTPLHYAVESNISTPKIKAFIKACPRALKTQDRKGQVPLHIAASEGARLSSIRLLVFIYPESVDIETMKGETARKIAKRKKASPEVLHELKSGKAKG